VAAKSNHRLSGPLDKPRGRRIKLARDAMKLTQSELAEKMGVDVGTISRWERGFPMKPRDVAALAVALGVSPYIIDPEAAKTLGETARGTLDGSSSNGLGVPEQRYAWTRVAALDRVRAFLRGFGDELHALGASPDEEDEAVRSVRESGARSYNAEQKDWTEDEAMKVMEIAAEPIRAYFTGLKRRR
jgi:transcriptional regulator with XRE-family HTH domain